VKTLLKHFIVVAGSAVLGLAVGLAVSYAQVAINTWVGPSSANPLNYNITGLLNIGPTNQSKLGGLSLGGTLVVNGASSYLYGPTIIDPPLILVGGRYIKSGNALTAYGKVQVQDGTQGAARPMATADTAGTARWAPSPGSWGCGSGEGGSAQALTGIYADGSAKCADLPTAGGGGSYTTVCSGSPIQWFNQNTSANGGDSFPFQHVRNYYCPGSGGYFQAPTGYVSALVTAVWQSGATQDGCGALSLKLFRTSGFTESSTPIGTGSNSLTVTDNPGAIGQNALRLEATYNCPFYNATAQFQVTYTFSAK